MGNYWIQKNHRRRTARWLLIGIEGDLAVLWNLAAAHDAVIITVFAEADIALNQILAASKGDIVVGTGGIEVGGSKGPRTFVAIFIAISVPVTVFGVGHGFFQFMGNHRNHAIDAGVIVGRLGGLNGTAAEAFLAVTNESVAKIARAIRVRCMPSAE